MIRCEFGGHRLAHQHHRALAGVVDGEAGTRADAGGGGDVDEVAAARLALLAELHQRVLGRPVDALDVDIETAVNPELIGGYVVEFGDRLYDASVVSKLAALKKEFSGNLYESKIEQHGTV